MFRDFDDCFADDPDPEFVKPGKTPMMPPGVSTRHISHLIEGTPCSRCDAKRAEARERQERRYEYGKCDCGFRLNCPRCLGSGVTITEVKS